MDDAETQVDQLTPLVDSIKREAGEVVLAHMEERSAALFIFWTSQETIFEVTKTCLAHSGPSYLTAHGTNWDCCSCKRLVAVKISYFIYYDTRWLKVAPLQGLETKSLTYFSHVWLWRMNAPIFKHQFSFVSMCKELIFLDARLCRWHTSIHKWSLSRFQAAAGASGGSSSCRGDGQESSWRGRSTAGSRAFGKDCHWNTSRAQWPVSPKCWTEKGIREKPWAEFVLLPGTGCPTSWRKTMKMNQSKSDFQRFSSLLFADSIKDLKCSISSWGQFLADSKNLVWQPRVEGLRGKIWMWLSVTSWTVWLVFTYLLGCVHSHRLQNLQEDSEGSQNKNSEENKIQEEDKIMDL